jgi:hypothetical protein
MREKPLITWNSMISGLCWLENQVMPWSYSPKRTYVGKNQMSLLLPVYYYLGVAQLGNLRIGETLHSYIPRNNLRVEDFIVTALIDMYSQFGRLDYAEKVFYNIKDPCLALLTSIYQAIGT